MITKKVITIEEVKEFFNSSFNTLEKAMGNVLYDTKRRRIKFDQNALDIVENDKAFSNEFYSLDSVLFSREIKSCIEQNFDTTKQNIIVDFNGKKLDLKLEDQGDDLYHIYMVDFDKLLETQREMTRLNNIIKSGGSIYTVCTWWIDYDKYDDHFFQTKEGPEVLGIPVSPTGIYNTKDFSIVREKAANKNEFYDECIKAEKETYEKVRNNESDYFGGRTPAFSKDNREIWVEGYGKCLLRYPDGSPRLFVAVDIYLSDLLEQSNQMVLINNLIDNGLMTADVGIWYYQKYHEKGRYYFTDSWKSLMSIGDVPEGMNVIDIYKERLKFVSEKEKEELMTILYKHDELVEELFEGKRDSYRIIVPNIREYGFNNEWVEIRGTVIEKDDNGVKLFIGVNVDVSDTVARNRELEKLRIENEHLHLAEKLAIKAGSVLVWYQDFDLVSNNRHLFGNKMFTKQLGVHRDEHGLLLLSSLRKTISKKTAKDREYNRNFLEGLNSIYSNQKNSFKGVLVKHIDKDGEEVYFEHTVEVEERFDDGSIKLVGGFMRDVTDNIKKQERITYLANYDILTGLHNRNFFDTYIKSGLLPKDYSVLVFDLDGLKLVNDAFGHLEGDKLIKVVSEMIQESFLDNIFVARIGGDEFVVISRETGEQELTDQANLLESKIEEYNKNSTIEMNVSKGGYVVVDNDVNFSKAFTHAENLMYRRKLGNRSSRKSKVLDSILETLNAKTEETIEHSERIAKLAVKTMESLKMTRASEVEDMKLLAKVHDIGKITIPDQILFKPGRLTEEEYEVIKKHSEAGYKIIRNITDSDFVSEAVLSHHERWDGKGYPQGLKGEEIPLFARIIGVVDAYDAMTSDRVYHRRKSSKEAIQEIIDYSGSQFDPDIVKAFLKSCFNIDI